MSGHLAVLGGCGGIGRQLVSEAISAGWSVTVLDLPASIAAHPPVGAEAVATDASDPQDLARAAAQLPEGLTGFVNLCGFMSDNLPVADTPEDTWTEVIDGNLSAAYHAARLITPRMAPGGAVVNTGSGLGHFPRPGYGPYAISKAGIAALTKQLALELAPDLRVNCVAPSAVDTAFLRGGTGRSDEAQPERINITAYSAAIPLQRIATPEDVAGPILFLLSDAAAYITGQVLHINGGTYMP